MMSEREYLELKSVINERSNLTELAAKHGRPYQVIRSIYSLKIQEKTKSMHATHRANQRKYFEEFCATLKHEQEAGKHRHTIMVDLSELYDTQPWYMAQCIFRGMCEALQQSNTSTSISDWLKDTAIVNVKKCGLEESILTGEFQNCMDYDDTSGPLAELVKRNTGIEYEVILAQRLYSIGARFLGDGVQRAINLSKTPDALLTCSVVVCGTVIHWVESKALFGDPITLNENFTKQLVPYRDRYGPGLVVYWFGFVAEEAARLCDGKGILVLDRFPDDAYALPG
eukprot:m.259237 g.259237  ORF g.259237 m.259237 type:complete len:284 (+) comp22269_c0_seq1:71-922(+)